MIMGTQMWSIVWCSCVFDGPGVLTEVERDTVITVVRYGIGEVVRVLELETTMIVREILVCTVFVCEEDG